MKDNTAFILKNFLRFIIYGVITILLLLIVFGITHLDFARGGSIPELSITEFLQEILLFCCACIFAFLAHKNKANGLWLVTGFLACMFIRELDILFDMIFHGAWKYIAIPLAFFFIYFALRKGIAPVIDDLACFMRKKSYPFLCLSLIILLIISRMLGCIELVRLIAQPEFQYSIKNFMEESAELLGYFILFLSSCSYYYEYRIKNKEEQ